MSRSDVTLREVLLHDALSRDIDFYRDALKAVLDRTHHLPYLTRAVGRDATLGPAANDMAAIVKICEQALAVDEGG